MKKAKINHVKTLRQNSTDVESHLWYYLRARRLNNYKFRRQYLVYPYVVDFICLSKKLIIECDGGQHAGQVAYDKKREAYLIEIGYKIMRVWNNEVLEDTESVLDLILEKLESN